MESQVNRGGRLPGGGHRPSESRVARHVLAQLALPVGRRRNPRSRPAFGATRGAGRSLAQLELPAGRWRNLRGWPIFGSPRCVGDSLVWLAVPTGRWRGSRRGMLDRRGFRQRSNYHGATRAISRSVADNAMIERSHLSRRLAFGNRDSREPQTSLGNHCGQHQKKRTTK